MNSAEVARAFGTGRRPRRWRSTTGLLLTLLMVTVATACGAEGGPAASEEPAARVQLVPPRHDSDTSVEEAILSRRSVRDYSGEALTLAEVSQLLWAAQGTTDPRGFRTVPSAGALYPLEVYVVAGDVDGLDPGVYRYLPDGHELAKVATGDRRAALAEAAVDQAWVAEAAVDLVITAVPARTTAKYGERGIRYVQLEAGHAGQNIYLQAEALHLGVTVNGAFDDDGVRQIVAASTEEVPLYVISVGRRA